MINRLSALSLIALIASACYPLKAPVASTPTNNPNIEVHTLFTHDGCTVYRFFDTEYHYYARCDGAPANSTTMSTVSCGRHCTREEEIPTVGAGAGAGAGGAGPTPAAGAPQ